MSKKSKNKNKNNSNLQPQIKKIDKPTECYFEGQFEKSIKQEIELINKNELETTKNHLKNEEYLQSNHDIYNSVKQIANKISDEIYYSKQPANIDNCSNTINDSKYLFLDFENNMYYDGNVGFLSECYENIDGTVSLCNPKGIYINNEIFSSSKLFLSNKDEISNNINYLKSFEMVVNHVIDSNNSLVEKFSLFCMLPEAVDVFNTRVRRCLNTSKGKIISIPKSIAISYNMMDCLEIGDRYCVVDFDGLHPVITQLSIGQDINGNKIVQREGFLKNGKIESSVKTFVSDYLDGFSDKYNLNLTLEEKDRIVRNKEYIKFFILNEPLIVFRKGKKITIDKDDDVFKQTISSDKIFIRFGNEKYKFIFASSIFNEIISDDTCHKVLPLDAFSGLTKIRDILIKNPNAIIWKEMLPKISLEVIDDKTGRFKTVDLISEQVGQNINLSLDEELEISSPGTITLQKGKKEYYLPLHRDIYSEDINSVKEAHFFDKSFPLEDDLLVELVVKYNYLSDSPIKIYARPKDSDRNIKEFCNAWVDPHEITIYSGPLYEGHAKDMLSIWHGSFENVADSLYDFANGDADLDDSSFYQNIAGETYHDGMKQVERQYKAIRSVFDSDNYDTVEFDRVYENQDLDTYYENALDALNVDEEYYSKEQIKKYKKCLNRLLSDTIVSSWYYNPSNEDISNIYKILSETNQIKVLIRLSRCIQRHDDDIYNVFEILTYRLDDFLNPARSKGLPLSRKAEEYLRCLSANCWFNKEWINLFYYTEKGPVVINDIITMILNYLKAGNFRNDKSYRDIMELLVCISRLKNIDKTILNPNNERTKTLLGVIKSSYEKIIKEIDSSKLVSRLEIDTSQGVLFGYKNYIYMLIITLSGEGQINLVGYHDD